MPPVSAQMSIQSPARAAGGGGRTLDSDMPELKLGTGVLDVGCGAGEAFNPETVVGIDPASDSVDRAWKWTVQGKHHESIRFQVAESHRLDFPDETFDVVYSHTVLHFLPDPVTALKEQMRVTRKGGWVIASGVRDWGGAPFSYPPSPNWDRVIEASVRYWESDLMEHRGSGKNPVALAKGEAESLRVSLMLYCDPYAGKKCLDWFDKAGLSELRIEIQGRVHYQGHKENPPSAFDFLIVQDHRTDLENGVAELIASVLSGAMAMDLLDEQTLELATEEARAWYKDLGAFRFFPEFFVAGRVP